MMFISIISFFVSGMLVCFSLNPAMYIVASLLVNLIGNPLYVSGFILGESLSIFNFSTYN